MSERFKKVLDCPGLIFVKNKESVDDWKSSDNEQWKEVYFAETETAKGNADIKQALNVMRDISYTFQAPANNVSFEGIPFKQNEIQSMDLLGIHNEAFGHKFFKETQSRDYMKGETRKDLLYFGGGSNNAGSQWVQTGDKYDLNMLIAWSYAILKWYSEYGKAHGWEAQGRKFVDLVASKKPDYFDNSQNIEDMFGKNNVVWHGPRTYIGRHGKGDVPVIPMKRNLQDQSSQLPGKDKYWVDDIVALQIQGLTPNYSPFGPYDSEYTDGQVCHSQVNHWWYRRDYWGKETLLGIAPGHLGNVQTGPWRPIELRGMTFKGDFRTEMPFSKVLADHCGSGQNINTTIGAPGVPSFDLTWSKWAEELGEKQPGHGYGTLHLDRESTRWLGRNEPHIHMLFSCKWTWDRDQTLNFFETYDTTLKADQFREGEDGTTVWASSSPLEKDDNLPFHEWFGRYPEAGWTGDTLLETVKFGVEPDTGYEFGPTNYGSLRELYPDTKWTKSDTCLIWHQFDGDRGLMNFMKGGNSVDVNTDEGVLWAPWKDWWQYKWEGTPRRSGFNSVTTKERPGICLQYGGLLNPYFGVQFAGPYTSTFRSVFVMVAKVVSWFYKVGSKVQFSDMEDLLGGSSNQAIWDNYRFLQAFVTRIIMNCKLEHDKIEEIRKENTEIAKANPSLVVTEEKAMKTRLQENAQCFLINAISTFQEKRANDPAYVGTQRSPGFYNTVHGDTNAFINLLGFKKDVIHTFLNLKTSEAALLQPRIRLYKQRTDFTLGKDEWVTVDVPGPFETALNKRTVRNVLEKAGGRLPGSGIKEVNLEQRDGNASVNLAETKDVEIIFHFNTLEEIFLNYPQYKGDGSKPTYPFGTTPGVKKNKNGLLPVASVAELVFPVTDSIIGGEFNLQDFNNRANPDFRVILELGWTLPDSLARSIGKGANKFIKEIKRQNPFQSIVLMPYDSEINMRQNGTVELRVKYRGIEENIMATPETRLFPNAAGLIHKLAGDEKNLPDGLKSISKEIKENIEIVKKLNEKKKDKKKPLTSKESKELSVAEGKINTLLAEAQEKQMENFMDRDIQLLYKAMIDSGMYHRVSIPSALIGRTTQYEVDGETREGVIKYRPTRVVDDFKKYRINRVPPEGDNSKQTITKQMQERIARAKQITKEKNEDTYADTYGDKHEKATELNKENDTTFTVELQKLLRESFFAGTGDDFSEPVDFMYFGDILNVIYQHMLKSRLISFDPTANLVADINKFTNERTTFILGSVKTPHIVGDRLEYRNVNVGDIPVAMGIFNRFVVDYVIAKKNYNVSYIDFVVSFYKTFMNKYYTQLCFDLGIGADSFSPEIKFFEMFREVDKKIDVSKLQTRGKAQKGFVFPPNVLMTKFKTLGASPQVFKNKQEVKNRMKKYEQAIKFGKGKNYNKHPYYSYCYLGGQTIGSQNRDFAEDLANNIHHFHIGRDRGLVKNIEFSARDVPGRAESAYFSSNSLERGMFMIPRVYDVTVTLIGNNFFQSGQTFYVNPTLGMATKGKKLEVDLIKNSGLGGYYYVGKVVTNISPTGYETKLEGIKVLLTSQEDKKNKTHDPA